MVYITGLAVHQASTAYRGQGKTDEKAAFVIADQARMRQDLGLLRSGDEIAVDLRTLTARRLDLVNERIRQTNRLRAQLLAFFPALERVLDTRRVRSCC
ncbi:transposase [Streptomyces sp. HB-N217]|uniref:IS110 family transposase n=1 Tax=Streptomyces sp. HB-N217 TaxID=2792016 RepID=UPI0035A8D58D